MIPLFTKTVTPPDALSALSTVLLYVLYPRKKAHQYFSGMFPVDRQPLATLSQSAAAFPQNWPILGAILGQLLHSGRDGRLQQLPD